MKKVKKYKTLYLIERQKRKELEEQLEKANKASSDLGWIAMILLLLNHTEYADFCHKGARMDAEEDK